MPSQSTVNLYLALAFLCAIINLPPSLSHIVQGHSGPACFGIWVVLLNFVIFINGILWRDNALDRAPVFCDISSRITSVGPLGLLISNWCIIRYLAIIVTPNRTVGDAAELRKRIFLDYTLSFGFPLAVAVGSVVYQTARYQVFNLAGCAAVHALSWPTLIMSLIWPVIFSGASCAYSIYVIYWLVRQHRNVRQVMNNSNVHLSRFIRMCALAATYVCISAPYTIFGTIATIHAIGPYVPWKSWSALHDSANSLSIVRQDPIYELSAREWLTIVAGLDLFFFFSFANEYVAIWKRCAKLLGTKYHNRKNIVLPVHSLSMENSASHPFGNPSIETKTSKPQEQDKGRDVNPRKPSQATGDPPRIHVSIIREKEVVEDVV